MRVLLALMLMFGVSMVSAGDLEDFVAEQTLRQDQLMQVQKNAEILRVRLVELNALINYIKGTADEQPRGKTNKD